jgi:hypothetical protein
MSETLRLALAQATTEEKARLFVELAREMLQSHGPSPIPLRDEEEQTVGFLTPPNGLAALIPTDPAWIEEQRRRIDNPGKTYSVKEFLKKLKEGLARRAK